MRIHGAYVSESEVRDVTEFVKSQGSPDYTQFDSIVLVDEKDQGLEVSSERDEGYQRVIEFGRSAGELSISSIQRRFKVGYNKAARYMELLEEDGLVGPPKGAGKPRDFLGKR
jgi:S-DNA-T family DNA segregation ATPase FtsK/SpoIIIE